MAHTKLDMDITGRRFLFHDAARRIGMGGGMKGHENHGSHGGEMPHHVDENQSADSAIDPVNKATLDIATALTSVHQGKTYYFGSAENRTIFEAKPEQYAGSDQPDSHQHKSHQHGC